MPWLKFLLMSCCALGLFSSVSAQPTEADRLAKSALFDYVAAPDPSYTWKERGRTTALGVKLVELTLTSQRWHGTAWKHRLLILLPEKVDASKQALLLISGGSWRGEDAGIGSKDFKLPPAAMMIATVVRQLSCPVAILSQVPFQPMFEGRHEDALIAYTFDEFLRSDDDTWPLLLPMVKSAVRAMDTVQSFLREQEHVEIDNFTVTGASKRGWTTWLTAAVDKRVTAAAPMVIDMLNLNEQMKHQIDVWGKPSEQIRDYTDLKIFERIDTLRGRQLQSIVDPHAYLDRLLQPKLIFLGSNDPYWPVDASNLYWDDIKGQKYLTIVPNGGHDLGGDFGRILGGLVAIHQQAAGGKKMPQMNWTFEVAGESHQLSITTDEPAKNGMIWIASSQTPDFRDAMWKQSPMRETAKGFEVQIPKGEQKYVGVFGELVFDRFPSLHLSTNIRIFPEEKQTAE